MQMSYTRRTDSCKGLEEAPPYSFQTASSLSVLLCLQSVLPSPSIGQFIMQAFYSQIVSDTLVLVIRCVDFSPQTHRYKNYYLYKSN